MINLKKDQFTVKNIRNFTVWALRERGHYIYFYLPGGTLQNRVSVNLFF
ncbi:hypothetical protein LY11_02942 [Pedobacter cryoconitis]|uniref:Uncharacterized protein n=1 Tax=Pedobacter cryoconitis TaxID=188932 RepID=A0A327SKH1_9SPHI|nr:hypothetical protein LY11_02942 [Pedobacter cryoconitis]